MFTCDTQPQTTLEAWTPQLASWVRLGDPILFLSHTEPKKGSWFRGALRLAPLVIRDRRLGPCLVGVCWEPAVHGRYPDIEETAVIHIIN